MSTQTEAVLGKLKDMKGGWDGLDAARPSSKAIRKLKPLLSDLEKCRLPFPKVVPLKDGSIFLGWESYSREVNICAESEGDVQFSTLFKKRNEAGEVINTIESGGYLSGLRDLDRVMAWYLTEKACIA
jgi:hypothetical protein